MKTSTQVPSGNTSDMLIPHYLYFPLSFPEFQSPPLWKTFWFPPFSFPSGIAWGTKHSSSHWVTERLWNLQHHDYLKHDLMSCLPITPSKCLSFWSPNFLWPWLLCSNKKKTQGTFLNCLYVVFRSVEVEIIFNFNTHTLTCSVTPSAFKQSNKLKSVSFLYFLFSSTHII